MLHIRKVPEQSYTEALQAILYLFETRWTLAHFNTISRCDNDDKERQAIFKQLLDIDAKKCQNKTKKNVKMSDNLTDKLSDNLRNLLIDNDDLAERLCAMGSTSHAESNHARIVRRGYHVKGILSEF